MQDASVQRDPVQVVLEVSLLAYLATVPFGQSMPPWLRTLLVATILLALGWRVVRDRLRFNLVVPVLVFAASALISIAASRWPMVSLDRSAYAPISLLVFFALQAVLARPGAWRRLGVVLAFVIVAICVDSIVQSATGRSVLSGRRLWGGRATSGLPHPNDVGMVVILLPLAISLLWARRSAWMVALGGLVVPLVLAAVIASSSRNAWIGIAVATAGLFTVRKLRVGLTIAAILALSVFSVAYALDLVILRDRVATLGALQHDARLGFWLAAWHLFLDAPLLGQGVAVFGELYLPTVVELPLPKWYEPQLAYIPWAHNLVLEFLSERGAVGLAAFAFVIASAIRALRGVGVSDDEVWRVRTIGVGTSLAVFLAMGVFDLTFLKDWVNLVFWIVVALAAAVSEHAGSARTEGP